MDAARMCPGCGERALLDGDDFCSVCVQRALDNLGWGDLEDSDEDPSGFPVRASSAVCWQCGKPGMADAETGSGGVMSCIQELCGGSLLECPSCGAMECPDCGTQYDENGWSDQIDYEDDSYAEYLKTRNKKARVADAEWTWGGTGRRPWRLDGEGRPAWWFHEACLSALGDELLDPDNDDLQPDDNPPRDATCTLCGNSMWRAPNGMFVFQRGKDDPQMKRLMKFLKERRASAQATPPCVLCEGPTESLGYLAGFEWFECRDCGASMYRDSRGGVVLNVVNGRVPRGRRAAAALVCSSCGARFGDASGWGRAKCPACGEVHEGELALDDPMKSLKPIQEEPVSVPASRTASAVSGALARALDDLASWSQFRDAVALRALIQSGRSGDWDSLEAADEEAQQFLDEILRQELADEGLDEAAADRLVWDSAQEIAAAYGEMAKSEAAKMRVSRAALSSRCLASEHDGCGYRCGCGCHRTAGRDCPYCNGEGWITDPWGEMKDCSHCRGTGWLVSRDENPELEERTSRTAGISWEDASERDALLGAYRRGSGLPRYEKCPASVMRDLIARGWADPDDRQNDAPTLIEFVEFCERNPRATMFGYTVPSGRKDSRVSVEGCVIPGPVSQAEQDDFKRTFTGADEFECSPDRASCWYD